MSQQIIIMSQQYHVKDWKIGLLSYLKNKSQNKGYENEQKNGTFMGRHTGGLILILAKRKQNKRKLRRFFNKAKPYILKAVWCALNIVYLCFITLILWILNTLKRIITHHKSNYSHPETFYLLPLPICHTWILLFIKTIRLIFILPLTSCRSPFSPPPYMQYQLYYCRT